MVIVPTDKDKSAEALREVEEKEQKDLPPTYASISEPSTSSSPTLVSRPVPVPSNLMNYINISRIHDSIKEIFAIDPSLYIPDGLRPPLSDGETEDTRKNVILETIHGRIQSEVTFVDSKHETKRATMQVSSIHGGIKLKIHDHPYRPAISLYAKAQNSDIKILLPPSFHGPISILYTHGSVKRSSALNRNFATMSDVNGVMKSFLGDISKYKEDEGKGWKGDELLIEVVHGSVKLEYDDESNPSSLQEEGSSSKQSFAKRWFGFA